VKGKNGSRVVDGVRIKLARKILETVETASEKQSSRGYSAAEVIALWMIQLRRFA
jgi:hypothetical protein